ncbi:hypothetical protein GCM10009827_101190 [Dactylosporangium maewongense]|uniref:Uncharacterized protein n=1 Tax=Dactylosporangium maewongense TaxID=634393 RepID=A0ABP4NNC3_9ACTN
MRRLQFGELVVDVDTDGGAVADFLDRIAGASGARQPTHQLIVRRAGDARLVIDEMRRVISLTLPIDAAGPAILIGVLQAVTRGIAFLERSADTRVLLHGSAFTVASGAGVAVLDGGLGQGKTSLALAMARAHGRLLVDEFAFAHTTPDGVVLAAAPTLPWHVRSDMAPYTAPAPTEAPLRYPSELRATVATAACDAPLHVVLIPDQGLQAGRTEPVEPDAARHLLRWALTDHLCKLTDPQLDHVSILADASQVVDPAGRPLAEQASPLPTHSGLLQQLIAVPAFRVGVGAPADLPASVAAAGLAVGSVKG